MNVKMYKGKKPCTDGWEHIGVIENDGQWHMFVKENADNEWASVKVVAAERAQRKANYWLGWDGKRFANFKDTLAMMQHRPELLRKVEQMLDGLSLI
jgi:hypothetical protein